MTQEEWFAEGKKRFGDDMMKWKFVCPACKHVAAVEDWKKAGAPENTVAFSCVGRWIGGGDMGTTKPCNYAGGGLFRLNPAEVIMPNGSKHQAFAFA